MLRQPRAPNPPKIMENPGFFVQAGKDGQPNVKPFGASPLRQCPQNPKKWFVFEENENGSERLDTSSLGGFGSGGVPGHAKTLNPQGLQLPRGGNRSWPLNSTFTYWKQAPGNETFAVAVRTTNGSAKSALSLTPKGELQLTGSPSGAALKHSARITSRITAPRVANTRLAQQATLRRRLQPARNRWKENSATDQGTDELGQINSRFNRSSRSPTAAQPEARQPSPAIDTHQQKPEDVHRQRPLVWIGCI